MAVFDVLSRAYDNVHVRTVFGEPIRSEGMLVIPVAKVFGGGGGGSGFDKDNERDGEGGGFGMRATPVGVFVVKDGKVSWQPAMDLNKVILGGQLVGIVALLTLRSIVRMLRARKAP